MSTTPAAPPVHGDALPAPTHVIAPALLALYERGAMLYEDAVKIEELRAGPVWAWPGRRKTRLELGALAELLEDATIADDAPAALAIVAAMRAIAYHERRDRSRRWRGKRKAAA